jgi:hypothetical protein
MKTEQWLEHITALEAAGEDLEKLLPEVLAKAAGAVVARLLPRVEVNEASLESLSRAFNRLEKSGRKGDPGCIGREAILRRLLASGWPMGELYHAASRSVQWEPVWGGQVDTAASLRGLGGLGLLRSADADAPLVLARLLADTDRATRLAASEALRESRAEWAAALCVHHLLIAGDEDQVRSMLLLALLESRPAAGLELASHLLEAREAGERAPLCLALGESSMDEAAELLWTHLEEQLLEEDRRPCWLGLALSRCPAGRDRLLEEIRQMPPRRRDELALALEGLDDPELNDLLEEGLP